MVFFHFPCMRPIEEVVAYLKITTDSIYPGGIATGLPANLVGRLFRFRISELGRVLKAGSVELRRLRGVYYTPDGLARTLAEWALAPGKGTVLDPSFGGCAFLTTAAKVLASKGVPEPGRFVFGVDVDPSCMRYVRDDRNLVEKNCVVGDFLGLSPKDMPGAPFHAVVGNPPYVRHHWLNGTTRAAGRAAINAAGVELPATASAWAYFLIHALNFLGKRGRLAMLVPEAILQTDYSRCRQGLTRLAFRSRLLSSHSRPPVRGHG